MSIQSIARWWKQKSKWRTNSLKCSQDTPPFSQCDQGKELQTLIGHSGYVLSVAFSPDGKTIASASSDKTVKLWNTQGKELQTLIGHSGIVKSVAFSPDGKTIATASLDNTVKLWNLDLDDLLVQACTWIGDYLNNNRSVSKEDKGLCDGVGSIKH